ncbi:Uncharacterised protein [Staphylococcus saccharolyticus]|mgnify:FL=1|uniref:Uncharacterized protein n=1 Tax=Staphylococcus saccharolyticus TaxID=33028 RepID=A0A380GYQ7_9STAP|nr:Uncharacterised protein [Staphylococcus saccharolyticus]
MPIGYGTPSFLVLIYILKIRCGVNDDNVYMFHVKQL